MSAVFSSRSWAVGVVVLALFPVAYCLQNGLGRKPPLGFNTWNYFGCDINEEVVKTSADRLVALGLTEAGYTYLNIDDCWHSRVRDADNSLTADPKKFPSGMKALADAVHDKGLHFGIYSDAGLMTCAGYPGSRYHEKQDAALFASWGVDYLKYDNCFAPQHDIKERYQDMRDALNKTGRPIYFSMCLWGVAAPWLWGSAMGNSWRTDADISATWDAVLRSLDNGAAGLSSFAGPGGWNDPDMLEVGVGKLSFAQQRSHFALWALVKAPLLIGANLETISNLSLSILKAKEVIAINQDELGVAGDIIFKEGPMEVWAGPLSNNERAVVLFNRHIAGGPTTIRVTWSQLGYTGHPEGSGLKAAVRDLYREQDLGVFEDGFSADVPTHDVAVLRITPVVEPAVGSKPSRRDAAGADCGCSCTSAQLDVSSSPTKPLFGRVGLLTGLVEAVGRLVSFRSNRCRCGSACGQQVAGSTRQALQTGQQQHHQQQLQQQAEVTWRPWHNPEAVQVQAAKRAAAQAYRQAAASLRLGVGERTALGKQHVIAQQRDASGQGLSME